MGQSMGRGERRRRRPRRRWVRVWVERRGGGGLEEGVSEYG